MYSIQAQMTLHTHSFAMGTKIIQDCILLYGRPLYSNAPINLKLQFSPSGNPPKIRDLFKLPPCRIKKPFKCPTLALNLTIKCPSLKTNVIHYFGNWFIHIQSNFLYILLKALLSLCGSFLLSQSLTKVT